MKLLKKTNQGEAQAFLRSQLKMYMTVFFFYYYSESNPKQIAKSVVFVMNTLSETKVIDFEREDIDLFTEGSLSLGANLVYIWELTLRFHTALSYESLGPTVDGNCLINVTNLYLTSCVKPTASIYLNIFEYFLLRLSLLAIILWRNRWVRGNVPSIVKEG